MFRQTDGVRIGFAILLLIVASVLAPVLDEIAGFVSEAPYLRLLPAEDPGGSSAGAFAVLRSALSLCLEAAVHD